MISFNHERTPERRGGFNPRGTQGSQWLINWLTVTLLQSEKGGSQAQVLWPQSALAVT